MDLISLTKERKNRFSPFFSHWRYLLINAQLLIVLWNETWYSCSSHTKTQSFLFLYKRKCVHNVIQSMQLFFSSMIIDVVCIGLAMMW